MARVPTWSGSERGTRRRDRVAAGIHTAFRLGVLLKGIDGALEVIGSALPLFIPPDRIVRLVRVLTRHELSEDPHDFVATHLREAARHLASGGELFASLYLLVHGAVKLGLVWALLRGKLWAYPVAMLIFAAFGAYQMYRWSLLHSSSMFALTVLDAFVIALTWAEYRRLRRGAEASAGA